jgi:hypothetical protein
MATLALLGLPFLLTGCVVPSLEPLYAERDVIFEPAMIGVWEAADDSGLVWTFERAEGKAYGLTIREREETAVFHAHMLRIGKATYLDFFPAGPPDCVAESEEDPGIPASTIPVLRALHFIPVHSFWRVWFDRDDMRVATLQPDWLRGQLEEGAVDIAHRPCDDVVLLTASTAELQQLIREHAEDPEAFAHPMPLSRQP